MGTTLRYFVAQLKYYAMEYFGVLVYTTVLVQALQKSAQIDLFINILKYTFQTRFKIIPVSFIKSIWLTGNLLMLPNKCLTSKQAYS